jgi:hypothetical protein
MPARGFLPRNVNSNVLAPLRASVVVGARFLPMVLVLGLVAAIGRALQIGAAGEISRSTHLALEAVIEGARLALLLHVLGGGSLLAGGASVLRLLQSPRAAWRRMRAALHGRGGALALNLLGFAAIAALANVAIFRVADRWAVLAMLKHCGWIAEQAGPWVTILFLKNVSLIPWTLVFLGALAGWLAAAPAPGVLRQR